MGENLVKCSDQVKAGNELAPHCRRKKGIKNLFSFARGKCRSKSAARLRR